VLRRLLLWTLLPALVLLAAFMAGTLLESAIFDMLCRGQCAAGPYVD